MCLEVLDKYNYKRENMITDTQIISYCFSKAWEEKKAKYAEISSVTASEFLLFHTRENSKVDYYVINSIIYPHIIQNTKYLHCKSR